MAEGPAGKQASLNAWVELKHLMKAERDARRKAGWGTMPLRLFRAWPDLGGRQRDGYPDKLSVGEFGSAPASRSAMAAGALPASQAAKSTP